MVKITLDLSESKCRKCGEVGRMDRHHVKHEKLILRVFSMVPKRRASKTYAKLRRRYNSFNPKDVEPLCRDCHEEIHSLYRLFMIDWTWKEKIYHLSSMNWHQARTLMKNFRRIFYEWIEDDDYWDRAKWLKNR